MDTDFDTVLQDYGALISRVAASYEANPALSQELTQEMCLAVWQALDRFRGASSLKTYVLRVAHNKGVNHVAYYANKPKEEQFCEMTSLNSSKITDVERQQSHSQQVALLLHHVRQLPIQTRQIVTMSMEGLSYQDIAEVCGIQVNNVGVILNRARKGLLESMQND